MDYAAPADLEINELFERADAASQALNQAGSERETGLALLVDRIRELVSQNRELVSTTRRLYDENRMHEGHKQALKDQVSALTEQNDRLQTLMSRSIEQLGQSAARAAVGNQMISQALEECSPVDIGELSLSARREPARPTQVRPAAPAARPLSVARAVEGDEAADLENVFAGFAALGSGRPAASVAA